MATNKPIQSVVVTSAASSITFSGIDQSYTDLIIMADFTISQANASVFMRFNGDTNANFSDTSISGTGSAQYTDRDSSATQIRVSAQRTAQTATDRQHLTIHINDYTNTAIYKTCLARYGSVGGVEGFAGQWRSTVAINSITLGFASAYTFSPGTIVSLYGIKSGAPQAFGGDVVATDGTYWYHAFTTTGTFTPLKSLSVDYLVIAGGGAGGSSTNGQQGGGGGGAGGYLSSVGSSGGGAAAGSSISLNSQSLTVTVGAGGGTNSSGSNSSFSTVTATGGGKGAINASDAGGTGGSGGGGASSSSPGAGGAATASPVQGYAGGAGQGTNNYRTGAGGGAGAVGGNGNGANGATAESVGGAGKNTLSAWASATNTGVSGYFAGGGGGGAGQFANPSNVTSDPSTSNGGAGGGGRGAFAGGSNPVATSGVANTGSGGGGSKESGTFTNSGTGGNGGSGIVIVRYAV
jgi:hypothetical protein